MSKMMFSVWISEWQIETVGQKLLQKIAPQKHVFVIVYYMY